MKEHEVTVNGVNTTLLLDDDDAKTLDERGYVRKRAEGDTAPSTKARKATENK